jgi:hypothetical protein
MATIQEIRAADSYTGDPDLGGGNFPVVQIDTRPIEQLGAYTYSYNMVRRKERQRQLEERAKELAELTSYDLTSAIPKDREHLQQKWQDLYDYALNGLRDGKDPLDYMNNREQWLEYQKKKNELNNDLTTGKVRSTMYLVRQKEVQDNTDPDMKTMLQEELDKEANATPINTPLKYTNQFDLEPVKVTGAPHRNVEVSEIGRNIIGTRNYSLVDMDAVVNQAVSITSGLQSLVGAKDGDEQNQQQYRFQRAAGKLEPIESANVMNEALKQLADTKNPDGTFKYRREDGTINDEAVMNSGNEIVAGITEQIRIYNERMDKMVELIDKGAFKDKFGNQLHFGGINGLKRSAYQKISLDDGISPEDLLKIRILGASKPEDQKTDIKVTGLGIREDQLAVDKWYKAGILDLKRKENARKQKQFEFEMSNAKTKQEEDKVLANYFIRNIIEQPNIVQSDQATRGKDGFRLQIKHNSSLPFLRINPNNGKVEALIPIGGKPIYDKYEGEGKNKVPAKNARLLGYEGGHYEPEYLYNGEYVNAQRVADIYDNYKKNDTNWKGSLDQFLKMAVQGDQPLLRVRVRGLNGVTDQEMNASGMRIISNSNQKKGQAGVFSSDQGGGDEDVETSSMSGSGSEDYYEDQNR